MKKTYRALILGAVILASALLAYGLFTLPSARPADSEGFSAERVVADLEVISREHHSVAQEPERAAVRRYLVSRLEGLGADTVRLFTYENLVGPQNKHVIYNFTGTDILAEFSPARQEGADAESTYLLMIAHYDSRYSQPMPKADTVWSYGAADDGYGLGVILETISCLLKERDNWSQGVKVLFTDAEEAGMLGMKSIWSQNREEFDNVGMVINIEARGPWGPALLFETCPGNSKVMELYAGAAKYPYTYSLTTVVYSFMPNFTDFTIVKEDLPGLNFSTIADINHYHTNLDNFSVISPKSIQHYGEQVLPVALEYLTNGKYADKDYLRSDEDTVNFTIPLIGLLNLSKGRWTLFNVVLALLFLLLVAYEIWLSRRAKVAAGAMTSAATSAVTDAASGLNVWRALNLAGVILALALGVLAAGELTAWLCALIAGAKFSPFGIVVGVMFDNNAMICFMALLAAACTLGYYKWTRAAEAGDAGRTDGSKASSRRLDAAFGALMLCFVLGSILFIALGENLMFMIPLLFGTAALSLTRITASNFWLPLGIGCILLHAFSFLYALAMALTIGALGAVAMIAFIDLCVLVPLADLYLCTEK